MRHRPAARTPLRVRGRRFDHSALPLRGQRRLRSLSALLVGMSGLLGTMAVVLSASPASAVPQPCSISNSGNPLTNGAALVEDLTDGQCSVIHLAQGTYADAGNFAPNYNVSVVGYAENTTILSGAADPGEPVFTNDGPTVFLSKLTITGGTSPNFAGGVANEAGTVTLDQVDVTNNIGTGSQVGGVFNIGTMNITDKSSVVRNTSSGHRGCTGGIDNDGTMTISGDSIVSQNTCTATRGTGGGIANNEDSTLLIYQSAITNNSVPDSGQGGGIWNDGYLYMSGVTITGNVAGSAADGGDGGGVYMTTDECDQCASPNDGVTRIVGGLIANNQAFVTNDDAGDGGGVFVGSGTVLDMTGAGGDDDNWASNCGGGIYVVDGGGGTLNGTSVQSNQVGVEAGGGGVYGEADYGSSLTIDLNAVVNPNKADGSIDNKEFGGGPCGEK